VAAIKGRKTWEELGPSAYLPQIINIVISSTLK